MASSNQPITAQAELCVDTSHPHLLVGSRAPPSPQTEAEWTPRSLRCLREPKKIEGLLQANVKGLGPVGCILCEDTWKASRAAYPEFTLV
jgi:hypothetical protein